MGGSEDRLETHDPAARAHDGRQLSPLDPPGPGQAPSPAWLAQLGRAPLGEYANGREVLKRLSDGGLAVPGDDPLYQYLGANRVLAEVLKAQHEDHLGRMRAMLDEARQGWTELLTQVAAAGTAAVAARRVEDEAAAKRFSAELQDQIASTTCRLREAMAEERSALTTAIAVKAAEALAALEGEKAAGLGRVGLRWPLGQAWAGRGRSAVAWAALLALSVILGLAVLWGVGHFGSGRGRP